VTFLTVSTIEPRKGHSQILDAAEQLWEAGCDVCIVFVGKQGWNVEALVERINGHKYLGKKLFWLNGISDEYLGMVYKNSSCLIAASWGEGFGLPIVEAALNGIPMIVRDIPVHREVAGNNVVYFSGGHASDLGNAMASWIDDFRSGTVLSPDDINVLDWNQSAASLMQVILCEKWSDFLDVNL
jgi:glycosyltransferase involved in cell wall biosynthesis